MIIHPGPRPTLVYLVRHGESQFNLEKRMSGQLDPPLSSEGVDQSQALADRLRAVPLTGIYTSALRRTVETAEPTAAIHGLPIHPTTALNEMHLGVLEGRYRDARDPEAKVLWEERKRDKRHYRIPEGESFLDLAERVKESLKKILTAQRGGIILIVGHRNTNRVLFGMLMQRPEEEWPHLDLKRRYVYEIAVHDRPDLALIHLTANRAGLRSVSITAS